MALLIKRLLPSTGYKIFKKRFSNIFHKVVQIKIDRGKPNPLSTIHQNSEATVETIAVKRLKQLLDECMAELEMVKAKNTELEEKLQTQAKN